MKITMSPANTLVLLRSITSRVTSPQLLRLISGSQRLNMLTTNLSLGVYMLPSDPRKMIESRSRKQELYSPRKNSKYSTQKSSPMVCPEPTFPISKTMKG